MDYEKYLNDLISENKFFLKKEKPTIETTQKFLEELDNPDLSPKFRTIVSGTCGKGTVTKSIESYAIKNGLNVVTLLSPHIHDVRERISYNGEIISKEDFSNQIEKIKEVSRRLKLNPSYYEAVVLVGILFAKEKNVDLLNCEIGLGGTFDAVNAIKGKRLCALTFIGNDHKEIIGPTLKDIAIEKSGIFTNESIYNISYEKEYREILNKKGMIEYINFETPEISNKLLAKKLIQKILNKKEINEIDNVKLPCRFEIIHNIILDGAHSEPRFKDLKNKLDTNFPNQKFNVIFAMTHNHDLDNLNLIKDKINNLYLTHVNTYRKFWSSDDLQKNFPNGIKIDNPIQALKTTNKGKEKILVVGSFYLCAEIRNYILNS